MIELMEWILKKLGSIDWSGIAAILMVFYLMWKTKKTAPSENLSADGSAAKSYAEAAKLSAEREKELTIKVNEYEKERDKYREEIDDLKDKLHKTIDKYDKTICEMKITIAELKIGIDILTEQITQKLHDNPEWVIDDK